MIWVFTRAEEFLDVTVPKCVYEMVGTSFPKAMDAQGKRSHVLPQKSLFPI